MRATTLILILTALLIAPAVALGQGDAAYDEDLSGTWNVTIKPGDGNTCDRGVVKIKVRQWLMAVNDSEVEIEVLGNKRYFPTITGTVKGGKLVLKGEGKSLPQGETVKPSIVMTLEVVDDSTLKGDYYFLGVTTTQSTCVTFYEVEAKKQ